MGQATEGRNAEEGPAGEPRSGLALVEPDRPHNLGAAIRLCACLGVELHLVGPAGFPLTDRRVREAALDYGAGLVPRRHLDLEAFCSWCAGTGRRLVLLSTGAALPYHAARFRREDLLLLGSESRGVPAWLHERAALRVRVPMAPTRRALNLVVAGAIVLGEALRQTGALEGLERRRAAGPGETAA